MCNIIVVELNGRNWCVGMSNKVIHLFRGAEAYHTVYENGTQIPDPWLTDRGIDQALAIRKAYKFFKKPRLVLVSPSVRCLQTALWAFVASYDLDPNATLAHKLRIIAVPELQEVSNVPCNMGTPLQELRREFGSDIEFPEELFDTDEWLTKRGVYDGETSNV